MLAQIIDGVNDVIIANLRRLPREHVKRSINRLALADSDVASGFHAVSLRCPIAQTRINTPCRSSKCVHIQCFDAKNWLLFTKQTNSKKCPVCDITIASRTDLVVDEYFDEVLKRIPSTIYEVLIDAHGEWRTRDGMYSSSERTALGMREAHSISRVEGGSRVRPSGEREAIVVSSHGSVIEVREIPRGTISAAAPSKPLSPVHTNIPTSPYSSGARVDGLGRWVVPQRSSGCQTQRDSTLSAPYDPSRPVLLSAHPAWLAAIYGLLLLGGLIEVCGDHFMLSKGIILFLNPKYFFSRLKANQCAIGLLIDLVMRHIGFEPRLL
ncbi:SUMO ligase siz1 [Ceratobasidium sp. 428]|nr:SUMO ligase siz1 [Ceratobasidium sp. 428]